MKINNNQSFKQEILTFMFCTTCLNWLVLASAYYELSCGQTRNAINLDIIVKIDPKSHGLSPHKTKEVFYMSGPNKVTLT